MASGKTTGVWSKPTSLLAIKAVHFPIGFRRATFHHGPQRPKIRLQSCPIAARIPLVNLLQRRTLDEQRS